MVSSMLPRLTAVLLLLPLGARGEAYAASHRAAAADQQPHRYLDAVPSPTLYPWVVGKNWTRSTRVTLTVRYPSRKRQRTLTIGHDGSFGVAIKGVRWCTGLVIEAVDGTGYPVVLHGANTFRACPPVTESRSIVIRPLHRRDLQARQYLIDGRNHASSYRIHVGDMLYVYVQQSLLSLHGVDGRHIRLIEAGRIPECPPNADCLFPSGVYYRVVALRPGDALLPIGHGRHVVVHVKVRG